MSIPTDSSTILPPKEMYAMRKCGGCSFRRLSRSVKVSTTQLCEYENGKASLREDQLRTCEKVLLRIIREKNKQIVALLAQERGAAAVEVGAA
jgi:hypothetical protein